MLLLELNSTRKKYIDKNIIRLDLKMSNNKDYKIEIIENSIIYIRKSEIDHLVKLYYLVF